MKFVEEDWFQYDHADSVFPHCPAPLSHHWPIMVSLFSLVSALREERRQKLLGMGCVQGSLPIKPCHIPTSSVVRLKLLLRFLENQGNSVTKDEQLTI